MNGSQERCSFIVLEVLREQRRHHLWQRPKAKRNLKRRNMKSKTESAASHVKDHPVVASEKVRIEVPPGPSHDQIQQRAYG